MSTTPQFSIILPTYCPTPAVAEKLESCLKSLYPLADDCELIVVEQGIRQFDLATPRGANKPHAAYLHLPDPCGFARAVNLGVLLSRGHWLAIINNDIVFEEDWLAGLHAAQQRSGNRCALMAPVDYSCPRIPSAFIRDSWWSCVLIHRAVWDDVGPLDEKHLPYRFHDQDWSIRAHRKGYSVLRTTMVQVRHDEASTYKEMPWVEESPERDLMIRRYGVPHYIDYVKREAGVKNEALQR